MAEEDDSRTAHFNQLRWSLQGLAIAGSEQLALFPEYAAKADELAQDFDHWGTLVRDGYEGELSALQTESLTAIDQKLATMSRDGAEFDVELWTDAALCGSEQWADVRKLAASALEAFGWPVESPSQNPGDRGPVSVR
jgi:hypothetical protein